MVMNLKNNKGWAMPVVIITVTIMVIISAALLNNIVQSYHYVGSQDNIGDAYFAGEAALDRWFNVLSAKVDSENIRNEYHGNKDMSNPSSREEFANFIIGQIKNTILEEGYKTQKIDIAGLSNEASIYIESIENMTPEGYEIIGDEMRLIVGIQASAIYSKPSSRYTADDKKVYGQMEFKFKLPEEKKFKLLGPVYSFGDFIVKGSKTHIKGDTYVFGSFPQYVSKPEQWYYGGIFALKDTINDRSSELRIDGNAYSRSFIRTGMYLQDDDKSWIYIEKDAICQAIQLFGDGDRVLVYRNAYTFDDLEVNGEDSVIGINGSFIGLSKGLWFHDQSSGIINSSTIHNLHSPDSFLSRIIINGDVLNRGGSFKINEETGKSIGQIEDASVGWDNRGGYGGNAFYKTYKGDFNFRLEYHKELKHQNDLGNVSGFANLFQAWEVQSKDRVKEWFVGALGARGERENYVTVPKKLSGYWDYEIAANDRIYTRKLVIGDNKDDNQVANIRYLNNGGFVIDNIYTGDKNELKYGNDKWDGLTSDDYELSVDERMVDYMMALDFLVEGIDEGGNKSGDSIYDDLLKLTHFFAERTYPDIDGDPYNDSGFKWDAKKTDNFRETLIALNDRIASKSSDYILNVPRKDAGIYDIDELYNDYYESIYGVPGSLYNKRNEINLEEDNEYYLIVNSNPDVHLKVSGKFNGIIFTAGKIYLSDKADIWGAIIAAGHTDSAGNPDIEYVTVVTEEDVDHLNAGDKAGIYADGEEVKVDFYLGYNPYDHFGAPETKDIVDYEDISAGRDFLSRAARERLLEKFKDVIDLTDIF